MCRSLYIVSASVYISNILLSNKHVDIIILANMLIDGTERRGQDDDKDSWITIMNVPRNI